MEDQIVERFLSQKVTGYEFLADGTRTHIEHVAICKDGKTYRCQSTDNTSNYTGRTTSGHLRNFVEIDDE